MRRLLLCPFLSIFGCGVARRRMSIIVSSSGRATRSDAAAERARDGVVPRAAGDYGTCGVVWETSPFEICSTCAANSKRRPPVRLRTWTRYAPFTSPARRARARRAPTPRRCCVQPACGPASSGEWWWCAEDDDYYCRNLHCVCKVDDYHSAHRTWYTCASASASTARR